MLMMMKVQQPPSSIDIMLFFEEKSGLVIITRSLLLTQYQVAEDGRVTRTGQVKLSITGDIAESGLKFVVSMKVTTYLCQQRAI